MRMLGIAIPTYERPAMTFEVFAAVQNDPRVAEVTIFDDGSAMDTWQQLAVRAKTWSKVRFSGSGRNVGCYLNKHRTMQCASWTWEALIDSDNVLDARYLDALDAIDEWNRDTLYLPVLAQDTLDYRAFAGLTLTRDTVAAYLMQPFFGAALNTGNFFVHRATYLDVFDVSARPSAADSLYFVYCWLASGRRVYFVPNMTYQHRVHHGYWMEHADESMRVAQVLTDRMAKQQWDVPCIV